MKQPPWFGILLMVNIGAFFGPMVTLCSKDRQPRVLCIGWYYRTELRATSFYKEPHRGVVQQTSLTRTFGGHIPEYVQYRENLKFVVFLLIVAGFWTMYNQLFFTLPSLSRNG